MEEKPLIKEICKSIPEDYNIREFYAIWSRFHNWEKNPPIVALEVGNNEILGFSAMTFQKRNVYCNHYAFAVKPEKQGQGIGTFLWDATIKEAKRAKKTRIKTSADQTHAGYHFFLKLGWKPIARKGTEYKFEASIENVNNIEDFKNELRKGHTEVPISELIKYKYMDECFFKFPSLQDLF